MITKKQMTEEDIKLRYITPAITAKWQDDHITMETAITDGRVNIKGTLAFREKPKKADYILYISNGNPIAVIEAKLDDFYLNVLIKGLYLRHICYDDETNGTIDTLLLRLVDENDKPKPNRKAKLCFEPVELSVIRRCLFDRCSKQVQAEKETAVEVIGELLEKVL